MSFDNSPIRASIIWKGNIADPAHLVHAITPDGHMHSFNWWGRLLVKLLGKHITKQWKRNCEANKQILKWRNLQRYK